MFVLRKLPYDKNAFKGEFISERTFDYHYEKHHQTYVNNLNNLIKGTDFENKSLYDIVLNSSGGIFNNAAQIYNHDFYWDCISPNKSEISKELQGALKESFGDDFKDKFLNSSTTLFGSGWCWVVYNTSTKKLEIVQTSNASTPVVDKKVPILVVDVWEHAYYIDYKNARPKYLEEFYNHINWGFVSCAYEWALKEGMGSVKFYMNDIHKENI
ncbi:superoxide dismutase [Helicobacter sp. MIT 14-3879]|uniref:superoxide dismutase n=1 Tax=Helicobacter sp. MIT 14-3879 TaxID=2040649 RepID=UPI000E1EE29A|nr:superoxide dismutase [Helicobacter sp. MIT 14-3879]RDU65493.1 superoxide dismutase [Helicobacter sp. MIT 14-3879]